MLDTGRANKEFGFKANKGFREGLIELVASLKEKNLE